MLLFVPEELSWPLDFPKLMGSNIGSMLPIFPGVLLEVTLRSNTWGETPKKGQDAKMLPMFPKELLEVIRLPNGEHAFRDNFCFCWNPRFGKVKRPQKHSPRKIHSISSSLEPIKLKNQVASNNSPRKMCSISSSFEPIN